MVMAFEEAKKARDIGEVPVGALIVKGNMVIARGHNLKESTHDPTSHAEIEVLRKASKFLKTWRLSGCCLYVTLEPCVMCAGALVQARIHRLVYATVDKKGGAIESVFSICSDPRLNHMVKTQLLDKPQSSSLLREFFKHRRS